MTRPVRTAMLAGAACVLLLGCGRGAPPQRPPPDAGFIVVQEQSVTLTEDLPGRTNPTAIAEIVPQVSGILKRRLFEEGSEVKAGQPLYQIDPAPYQAAYDSAAAGLADAKAQVARYASLLKQNAIASQTYDDADSAYKQAAAALETARINLGYTTIRSPISGRVGASLLTQGALVTAYQTTALATIQTLDPIYVDITESSSRLIALEREIANGEVTRDNPLTARVTLQLDDGTAYPEDGKLQFTDVTVDPSTGTVRLRVLFPNPNRLLLPGMYVRARIIEGIRRNAILAPQQGVSHNEKGEPTALVIDEKNIARLRTLAVSRAVGNQWLVTSGLKPGDKLIVDGLINIRADLPVHPVPAGAAPGPQP